MVNDVVTRCSVSLLVLLVGLLAGGDAVGDPPRRPPGGSDGAGDPPPPLPCDATQGACWVPPAVSRWQYQLQGTRGLAATGYIETSISARPYTGGAPVSPVVFDIDLYQDGELAGRNDIVNTAAVDAIHAAGGRAICYLSAGSWENWRPDAGQFPESLLGRKNGWPGELWLDIRQTAVLLPIMEARVQRCAQAGFDGVEWGSVDGYSNKTGFPLTYQHQLVYNAALANLAHKYGLSVALKNDVEQAADLQPYFDYTINEQCQQFSECDLLNPFLQAGKAVFQVEYKGKAKKICPPANTANRNAIIKSLDLLAQPWTPCR